MTHVWPLPKIEYIPLVQLEETRPVALVYSRAAWAVVQDQLRLPIVWQAEVLEATEEHWTAIGSDLQGDVVYAVGGGLAADAAKYMAFKGNLPVVCIPTALSVDAFVTWASGIRRDGCVYYIETGQPSRLIVDLEVLAAAPETIRAAGICDVLSIATGSWDWRFAHEQGKNPPGLGYVPYVDQAAQAILQGALDCAEAAGCGDHAGLKQLLDCVALEVQLCNQIGHSRPEEGSEHYFAYSVENTMGKGLPHGDLVGPGILIMAALQGQDTNLLRSALEACHIPLTNIPDDVIRATLRELPEYSRQHQLPYGIAHTLTEQHLSRLPCLD
jgi:glycerol-1-phosphate dehydrogenase [NAD(P)+]